MRLRHVMLLAAPLASAAVACHDRGLDESDTPTDADPPVLVVSRPERATISSGTGFIRVEGQASDGGSGISRIDINGERVGVDPSGAFSTSITPAPGTSLIHVVATDGSGNQASDTRAILAGTFVPLDQPVAEGLAVTLSPAAFATVGDLAAGLIGGADLGALVAPLNPVLDTGVACLNAQVNVTGVGKSAVRIELVPGAGRLALSVEVDDLDVPLQVPFELACVGGDASARITADRVRLGGDVLIDADGGLAVTLDGVTASFDGFSLDVGAIPSQVVDLFADQIGDIIAGILVDQVDQLVAPLLDEAIAGLAAGTTIDVLGAPVEVSASPRVATIDDSGATLVLDTAVSAPSAAPGMVYLASPQPLPALDHSADLALAVADDALNQALAALWAAGGLDLTIPLGGGDYGDVGVLFDRVHLTALLPPVVQSGPAGLSVALGDVRFAFEKEDGGQVVATTSVVVNATAALTVAAAPDGGALALQVVDPQVFADFEEATGANQLAADQVETLISFVTTRALAAAGDLLGQVPIPSVAGASVENLSVAAGADAPGYLVASGHLVKPAP